MPDRTHLLGIVLLLMQHYIRMKSILVRVVVCLLGVVFVQAKAADNKLPADVDDLQSPHHGFSLLPKAFQKNPELEMTAFTVMTDYGRTITPPSAQAPVYYQMLDNGLQMRGDATGYSEIPPPSVLTDALQRTLAADGYLPAKGEHKPSLLLVYFRGAHDRLDRGTADDFPDLARRHVMERALLIGGKEYAHKLEEELNRPSLNIDTSLKHEFLKEQALDNLYYIVVSAYNYDDVLRKERRLLWRTTMTVNSRGISMNQGMPAMIVMGENFYGRETTQPMVMRRDVRSGTIKLGPLNILENGLSVRATPPAQKEEVNGLDKAKN